MEAGLPGCRRLEKPRWPTDHGQAGIRGFGARNRFSRIGRVLLRAGTPHETSARECADAD
jgi:hypothetical protein